MAAALFLADQACSFRARVYWNSRAQRYSVLDQSDHRLRYHAGCLEMVNVRLVVRPSGRRKLLATGQKNVHAFAVGRVVGYDWERPIWFKPCGPRVAYDPHRSASFIWLADGSVIEEAARLLLWIEDGRPRLTLPVLNPPGNRGTI